ncbi:Protein ERGIC-53 [Trichinella zimbabwensis]|uniref:Protein ERGIC-53 n=1 Tax=Trichinella zimbabwensis TaxID=268475 RepID=A0A0V1H4T8_9BILA|nr:Protein ERGIC-53 [Trichinella zimbabwensis]
MSNVNSLEHKIRTPCPQDKPVANWEPAHSTAMEEIKRELEKIHLLQQTQQLLRIPSQEIKECLSLTHLCMVIAVQSIIVISVIFFRCKSDREAKKIWQQVGITDGLSFYSPYQDCIILDNVQLPPNGFFGLSAATDDHDVLSFVVFGLLPDTAEKKGDLPDAEREQLKAKFEEMKRHFEAEKVQFQKEHPDEKPSESDDDEQFEQEEREDVTERIVRQLFEEAIQNYLSSGGADKPHAAGVVASGETFNHQEVMQVMDFV